MRVQDLHELAKIRDRFSYLYVEHARIEQYEKAIAIHDVKGETPVPCAALAVLMLGPGTSITHAAICALTDCGCLVLWCGEQGVRFYAAGNGTTRNAQNLMIQAQLWALPDTRIQVIRRLYTFRFKESLDPSLTLEQIRGMEGVRVRESYAQMAKETGITWQGRSYKRTNWNDADPVNRALSSANACLYGICHAAIVAAGFSPALGFIHTGKQLSFVYDVADLYKTETTIPAAFHAVASETPNIESEIRKRCRDLFAREHILARIVNDIEKILDYKGLIMDDEENIYDADNTAPGALWDPETGEIQGGINYGDNPRHDVLDEL